MSSNVLVVGGGGREHALAWKLAQSPRVARVYVAPGNAGTAREPRVENVPIAAEDMAGLLDFVRSREIELTVVGPEAPLVAGLADAFEEAGLACFGPGREAAQLEGSKAFAKRFLARHGIPSADYAEFDRLEPALDYIRSCGAPIVVKADGLAAGKGVVVAQSVEAASDAARAMLTEHRFGEAGQRIVVEECLEGEEASFIAIVDGADVLPLASSQDHKARDEGDRGPNTGGMGAYSPAPVVTEEVHERILREVVRPAVRGLAEQGVRYRGFLYAGLMIGRDGTPRVLEFNCRCGDPETQPIMVRLRSDLAELCLAATQGRLGGRSIEWDSRVALGVVLAAGGYPEHYRKGDEITGLEEDFPDSKIFHAGTAVRDGKVVTAGGRVLCVVGLGDSVSDAQRSAYERADRIHWPDVYCRRDIGYRAIARELA